MLEKTLKYTAVDIAENGNASVRLTTIVTDDGVEISKSHYRQVYTPNDSIEDLPSHVSGSIAAYRAGL